MCLAHKKKNTDPDFTAVVFKIYWKRQIINESINSSAIINSSSIKTIKI
jgi:hypothetical protein